jgi:hypothetical protein
MAMRVFWGKILEEDYGCYTDTDDIFKFDIA